MLSALKTKLVRQLKNRALKHQYHLVAEWKIHNYPLVQHLCRLFDLYRVDCVFDVGGNLGQYRDLLRDDVGFKGWIVTFEPVSKYATHLKRRALTDSRWKIVDSALGARSGTAEINVTQSPGLNSFLTPSSDALPDFWAEEKIHKEIVRIARLDEVLPDLEAEIDYRAPYLKLDTQGFDLEVIKGAGAKLSQMCALQTEASVHAIYEGMPKWKDSMEILEQQGLELSGMFPVMHDRALRLIEFDCVFVNKALAPA